MKHVVVIYKDPGGGGFKIAPSTLIVHADDMVKFRDVSDSGNGAKLEFPDNPFKGQPEIGQEYVVTKEGPKAYPYKALCGPNNEFEAEGSRPIIIIYE